MLPLPHVLDAAPESLTGAISLRRSVQRRPELVGRAVGLVGILMQQA